MRAIHVCGAMICTLVVGVPGSSRSGMIALFTQYHHRVDAV
jgi:hypothetical protein